MINWIWKYRDFIDAFDKCSTSAQWINSYMKNYFNPNFELLNSIHLKPKGFDSEKSAIIRMENLGKDRFNKLRDNIGNSEIFERSIISATETILGQFKRAPRDMDVYVIVGLDCTNIYSTDYDDKTVTVLCLESVNGNLSDINLLLSHECHHWVRSTYYNEKLFGNCVGERIATEGLAINYSEYLFPGYQPFEYCYVPEKTVKWVSDNWSQVDQIISERLFHNDITSNFFTRNRTSGLIPGEPPRIGYVYGYMKIKNYLNIIQASPIDSVDLDWKTILR